MKVLSLFSGIGGFDLGLERAGMTIVGQCEIDPYCSRVLAAHWPGVPNYGDVRNVGLGRATNHVCGQPHDSSAIAADAIAGLPRIDLVCGGFPCQDLSVAGKRAGLDGARSGLWFEFKRVLSELRPQWCLIENVPGLLSSNGGRDFGIILDGLGECGFGGIAWAVLDSQHFGVAQRRRRVFIVGGPTRRSAEQILSLCESCGGHPAPGRTAREDVAASLTRGSASASNEPGRRREDDVNLVANTLDAHLGDKQWLEDQSVKSFLPVMEAIAEQRLAHSLRAEGFDASEDGTGRGTPLTVAGASVRRPTPTECERLQGFPDGWTDLGGTADGPRYRALGNTVTVPVIEYLGLRIMAVNS